MSQQTTTHYKHAETIIDRSLATLGLNDAITTRPGTIREIMAEFRIHDLQTNNSALQKFLVDAAVDPQDLRPILDNIKKAILLKHPAIVEFAETALEKEWFYPSESMERGLHVMFLLEGLTAAMSNSHRTFLEVQRHYNRHKKRYGIDSRHPLSSFWQTLMLSHDVFGSVKSLTMDPAMVYFRTQREDLTRDQAKALSKDRPINYLEYKYLRPLHGRAGERLRELLRLNIYEAGITESIRGLDENAECAHELAEDLVARPPGSYLLEENVLPEEATGDFYQSIAEEENRFPVIELSQAWTSLYTTWNMAFVLFDYDDLDLLLPKLFIPSLIDAEPKNYGGVRAISLWLTINHVIFRRYDGTHVPPPRAKQVMAKTWAAINKRYAVRLAQHDLNEGPRILAKSYKQWFAHPVYHFLQLVKDFFTS